MSSTAELPVAGSRRRLYAVLALFGLLLFAAQAWVTYAYFTTQLPGGNDFFPRWYGARQLLLEGRNPYDQTVTREIEAVLDPLNQRTNSFNFAFPLPVIFSFFPLAWLSYAWAQAIWIITIIWLACVAQLLLLSLARWRLTPGTVLAILLLTLSFYPVTRTIFLGQFTIHVLLFLVLGFWLRWQGYPLLAGVSLSLATLKPQLLLLLLPWFILWFLYCRDWRALMGLVGGGVAQLLLSLLLLPSWPLDFVRGLGEYADRAGGRNLLQILLAWLPAGLQAPAVTLASVLLLLLVLYQIREPILALLRREAPATTEPEPLFWLGTCWAIVVTNLVPFQTGTTNQVLLLIPFMIWGGALIRAGKGYLFWALSFGLAIGLWLLFRVTLQGAAEGELMFLPLPLLAAAGLVLWQRAVAR